ncbi:invertase inhibitor [Striga asiatica]|uniref:Invertase inhibitor n=1 Tax=Striga asiatica TaxID=4170 RepID=A0A5A7Q6U3_STRAF|nr:invertase inhibitor [Striga asiatica]
MANFHTSFLSILIVIITISSASISSSTCHKLNDNEIKHLCSKTSNLLNCYKLIKTDNRTTNHGSNGLANYLIEMATQKAKKIQAELNSFANKATQHSELRKKYSLVSKKYSEIIRNLEAAKKDIKSHAYKNLYGPVKSAYEETVKSVKLLGGFMDHRAHLQKQNKDLEFVLSIAKAVGDGLNKK